ncbi:hypothetical protein [Streptomyces sp. C10-9-1]|uniref:hypothetical protein n=1 Tax=Streptomyces sp. C10-9-1 TaxID=1859285 RepID=UPI003D763C83
MSQHISERVDVVVDHRLPVGVLDAGAVEAWCVGDDAVRPRVVAVSGLLEQPDAAVGPLRRGKAGRRSRSGRVNTPQKPVEARPWRPEDGPEPAPGRGRRGGDGGHSPSGSWARAA